MLRAALIGLLALCAGSARSQTCTNPGQTPNTAIFVCGSESLSFSTQQFCGVTPVPVSCPGGFAYADRNPSYFRFACFTSGTLGFIFTPSDPGVDLNWQLFDITSTNPFDIFTNSSLFIAGNWSSEPGNTGASFDGTEPLVCAGPGGNPFSRMPNITAGRSYLLLLSNESASVAPFNLLFTGGSATITDAVDPHLREAIPGCDRIRVRVRMNKSLLCSSVATNGSDFVIPGVNVISATPLDCNASFGTDIINLTLDQPLPFGTHRVEVRVGTDGNSLLDICGRAIVPGEFINFTVATATPSVIDGVFPESCSGGEIEIRFSKPIQCGSVNASDFTITGPQTIVPAVNFCNQQSIRLGIPPGFVTGDYVLRLINGPDGNTILDECDLEVPEYSRVLRLSSPVFADFTVAGNLSCGQAEMTFTHDGANGVNEWTWDLGNGQVSAIPSPQTSYAPGHYQVSLIVSNGDCRDTSSQSVTVSGGIRADFFIPETICAGDTLPILNNIDATADRWHWDFGNGMSSTLRDPPAPAYFSMSNESYYSIRLIAETFSDGCIDTVIKSFRVINGCSFDVPTAFTPNGDGKNDRFGPVNPLRAREMKFRVFNRFGQQVF